MTNTTTAATFITNIILAGDGGNTVESVALRLAVIGHASGRFNTAAWIADAVRHGDREAAIGLIEGYALTVANPVPARAVQRPRRAQH